MESKDVVRMLIEEHQKFEKANHVSIQMVCPRFSGEDTPFASQAPSNLWKDYFDFLARRVYGEHRSVRNTDIAEAREQAYADGKAEAEIRGDGVPYRPEGK